MKHYLELVPISARVHRKQNRMSIFCIILAVFLVTTIFGMADMFIRSQILQAQIDGGNFHIGIKDITDEEATLISRRPDIQAAARYGVLNFRGDEGYTFEGKNAVIVGCDEEYMTKLMVDIIEEGNFPQNNQQVMITLNAKEYLGLQIGDTVAINTPDGTELHYEISGFCNDASKTMSEDSYGFFMTTSAFREIYPTEMSDELADYNSILCVQFSDLKNIQNTINNLKEKCHLSDEQVSENTKLLGLLGQSSNSFMVQIYMSAIILFLLVMFAGIIMIASSLNSNRLRSSENITSASDLAEDILIKCDYGEIRLFTIQSTVSIDQGSPDGKGGFLLAYQSKSGSKYGIVVLFSYSETIWMKTKSTTWGEWKKIQLS